MLPEAQRIAIAEACDFERIIVDYTSSNPVCGFTKGEDGSWRTPSTNKWLKQIRNQNVQSVGNYFVHVPTGKIYADFDGPDIGDNGKGTFDYLNDLNAMHEVEKILTWSQKNDYRKWLGVSVSYIWHATAAQRAEAILRTLNLWKD